VRILRAGLADILIALPRETATLRHNLARLPMRTGSDVFLFGPFELDSADRRLMRGRERVPLPDMLLDMLFLFVSHPGEILSNDALWEAGWKGIAVTPNTVTQAVKGLRKALGLQKGGRDFIENIHKHGYRFVPAVTRAPKRQRNIAVDALLAPFMTFVKGRAWLETLDLAAVRRALLVFEEAVSLAPDHAAAHIGLANACAMLFESTRTDAAPDLVVLQRAHVHAITACDLDGFSGDAWSTLAFVLHCLGEVEKSIAAARRAIALERYEWRHWLILAFVSWGGQRLRATRRVMGMYKGLAFAYWFAATVYVARGEFDEALAELRAGCAAADRSVPCGRPALAPCARARRSWEGRGSARGARARACLPGCRPHLRPRMFRHLFVRHRRDPPSARPRLCGRGISGGADVRAGACLCGYWPGGGVWSERGGPCEARGCGKPCQARRRELRRRCPRKGCCSVGPGEARRGGASVRRGHPSG